MPRWPSETLRRAALEHSRTSRALTEELSALYEDVADRHEAGQAERGIWQLMRRGRRAG